MTMCAAITVPIIKDGYRLYPGMPVSSNGTQQQRIQSSNQQHPNGSNMVINNRCQPNSQILYFSRQQPCNSVLPSAGTSGSPPEVTSMAASPPPRPNSVVAAGNARGDCTKIIVGGATGGHHVVLLKPRARAPQPPQQPQMSARSSFEVGPTQMNYWSDQATNRTAMSTSQLYIQKKRELCIQQQLAKQELAKKQQQQLLQQQQQQRSESSSNSATTGDQRKRKPSSQGDPNNNADGESSNPFRKFLRRLGFGGGSAAPVGHSTRHLSFESPIIGSDCESGIEQGVSATETGVAVSAWH